MRTEATSASKQLPPREIFLYDEKPGHKRIDQQQDIETPARANLTMKSSISESERPQEPRIADAKNKKFTFDGLTPVSSILTDTRDVTETPSDRYIHSNNSTFNSGNIPENNKDEHAFELREKPVSNTEGSLRQISENKVLLGNKEEMQADVSSTKPDSTSTLTEKKCEGEEIEKPIGKSRDESTIDSESKESVKPAPPTPASIVNQVWYFCGTEDVPFDEEPMTPHPLIASPAHRLAFFPLRSVGSNHFKSSQDEFGKVEIIASDDKSAVKIDFSDEKEDECDTKELVTELKKLRDETTEKITDIGNSSSGCKKEIETEVENDDKIGNDSNQAIFAEKNSENAKGSEEKSENDKNKVDHDENEKRLQTEAKIGQNEEKEADNDSMDVSEKEDKKIEKETETENKIEAKAENYSKKIEHDAETDNQIETKAENNNNKIDNQADVTARNNIESEAKIESTTDRIENETGNDKKEANITENVVENDKDSNESKKDGNCDDDDDDDDDIVINRYPDCAYAPSDEMEPKSELHGGVSQCGYGYLEEGVTMYRNLDFRNLDLLQIFGTVKQEWCTSNKI